MENKRIKRKARDDSFIYFDESLEISSGELMENMNFFDDSSSLDSESSNKEHLKVVEEDVENIFCGEITENASDGTERDNEPIEFIVDDGSRGWTRIGSKRQLFEFQRDPGVKIEGTDTSLDTFLHFFDDEVVDYIVLQTNLYASQFIITHSDLPENSRVRLWKPTN